MNEDTLNKSSELLDKHIEADRFAKYIVNINKKKAIFDSQLERFHERCIKDNTYFTTVIEKAISKYESDKHSIRTGKKGLQDDDSLYWFLSEYSTKYGRECNKEEWEKYGNMFTGQLVYMCGYYFNIMYGQGVAINVIKEEK